MPDQPTHGDLLAEIRGNRDEWRQAITSLSEQHRLILRTLGEPSDDGKGGSGLIGELRRTQATVGELNSLKSMGRGFLVALTITAGMMALAAKAWLASIIAAVVKGMG